MEPQDRFVLSRSWKMLFLVVPTGHLEVPSLAYTWSIRVYQRSPRIIVPGSLYQLSVPVLGFHRHLRQTKTDMTDVSTTPKLQFTTSYVLVSYPSHHVLEEHALLRVTLYPSDPEGHVDPKSCCSTLPDSPHGALETSWNSFDVCGLMFVACAHHSAVFSEAHVHCCRLHSCLQKI